MPVADTEVLFALNPKDPKHQGTLNLLEKTENVIVPDTAMLEFQGVLRARGRKPSEVKRALLAISAALTSHNVKQVKTISASLLALQCELEEKYVLGYFDSLVAASVIISDRQVISDDKDFDRISDLKRIPIVKLF